LEEIEKYKDEIMRKAKIGLEEFDKLRRELIFVCGVFSVE